MGSYTHSPSLRGDNEENHNSLLPSGGSYTHDPSLRGDDQGNHNSLLPSEGVTPMIPH